MYLIDFILYLVNFSIIILKLIYYLKYNLKKLKNKIIKINLILLIITY